MPRLNQLVGRGIQIAAIASIPSCIKLMGEMDISPSIFYIGKNAPAEYKDLIGKSERVRAIHKLQSIADHLGPDALNAKIKENAVREIKGLAKSPPPAESRLTGDADYCISRSPFVGTERHLSCYAVIGDKIESRVYNDYGCAKHSESSSSCKIKISVNDRFASNYQQASDISQELLADSVREKSTLVAMVMAFTSPFWLFLGGWIAKHKSKDA